MFPKLGVNYPRWGKLPPFRQYVSAVSLISIGCFLLVFPKLGVNYPRWGKLPPFRQYVSAVSLISIGCFLLVFPKLGVNYPQSSNASAVTFFSWLLLPNVSQTGGKLPHGGRLTDFYWTICEDTTKWLHFRERGVLGDEPNNFVGFVFHFFFTTRRSTSSSGFPTVCCWFC